MDPRRLAIIGVGSLRCGPPTLAALATYFGERDLEVRLFDADAERLDLADRLARTMFLIEEVNHGLLATPDPAEALAEADAAIAMVEAYCAAQFFRPKPATRPPFPSRLEDETLVSFAALPSEDEVAPALSRMLCGFGGPILSFVPVAALSGERVLTLLGWPPPLSAEQTRTLPHQALRWLRGEENVATYIAEHSRSPIRRWLDDVL